jgi:predicted  nucleic acid-binding Zn-ribbon protein
MEKLIATCLIVCALIGFTIAQNHNENTVSTSESSSTNVVSSNDSLSNPFIEMPKSPRIEALEKELAELVNELSAFEKDNESDIKSLERELAEMQNKTPNYEKESDAAIAKIEKEIAQLESELTVFENDINAKNQKLKDQIALKNKEKEGKTGDALRELKGDIQELKSEIMSNLGDIQGKKGDIMGLRGEIMGLRGERMGQAGELQGKQGEIMGKQGELMGKMGEIQGKQGEIQGAKHEQIMTLIVANLLKDGIISDDRKVKIEFNTDEFIVNNVKQSDAVFQRYKAKYIKAKSWNISMSKKNGNTNIHIDMNDEN